MATFVGFYSDFEEAFIHTVDKHAPVKQKKTMSKSSTILYKY
jgi:hypothetical protein